MKPFSKKSYCTLLKISALLVVAPVCIHVFGGLKAEALVGTTLPPSLESFANLDSQNRFYGMMFAVFAWVLWLASYELDRYRPALNGALLVFFAGGIARILSWMIVGAPSLQLMVLCGIELVEPLLLWLLQPKTNDS